MKHDLHRVGVTGDHLIDRVVDHLLGEVIGTLGLGVHAGALAHGLEPGQDLDSRGVVSGSHGQQKTPRSRAPVQG